VQWGGTEVLFFRDTAQLAVGSVCWPYETEEAYRAMGWYGSPEEDGTL